MQIIDIKYVDWASLEEAGANLAQLYAAIGALGKK
jgi:hypothetical protein